MSETSTDESSPLMRGLMGSDAMFFLALGFVVVALAVTIAVRH
jgi:hypothetical protein